MKLKDEFTHEFYFLHRMFYHKSSGDTIFTNSPAANYHEVLESITFLGAVFEISHTVL